MIIKVLSSSKFYDLFITQRNLSILKGNWDSENNLWLKRLHGYFFQQLILNDFTTSLKNYEQLTYCFALEWRNFQLLNKNKADCFIIEISIIGIARNQSIYQSTPLKVQSKSLTLRLFFYTCKTNKQKPTTQPNTFVEQGKRFRNKSQP